MSLTTRIRWAAWHGAAGITLRHKARHGYLDAVLAVDGDALDNPYVIHDELRQHGPFYKGAVGFWTARREVAWEVLHSDDFGVRPDLTSSPLPVRAAAAMAGRKPMRSVATPPSLSVIEPPQHTRLRRMFAGIFTPRAMLSMRADIEQISETLLDELARTAGHSPIDLVAAYTSQLPIEVISRMFGVPPDMRSQLQHWGHVAGPVLDIGISYATFSEAYRELDDAYAWMTQHLDRLRRCPEDDRFSRILQEQQASATKDRFTTDELVMTAMQIIGAGFETTASLLASGVTQLARRPRQLAALHDDPSLWANAVEEILRYESPVQNRGRFAKRNTELGGIEFPTNTLINCALAGANRDPAAFVDADRFDVRRSNARDHLAFGGGRHYCVGAALARAEAEIGLRMLFERFPDLTVRGPERRRRTRTLRVYEFLPVQLAG